MLPWEAQDYCNHCRPVARLCVGGGAKYGSVDSSGLKAYKLVQACTSGGCGQSNSSSLKTLQAMPTSQAAPNVTALNAVTALSNPNSLLIHLQCVSCFRTGEHPSHYLQCPVVHNLQPSTQYSFVEAACTTAGYQTGGVANVTTLDSAPVGQAPPSSSIPISLPCPSNGMLPFKPEYVITAYTLHHRVPSLKSQSEMWGPPSMATVQFHTYNPSSILFHQINSVVTDFLGVKLHGGLPWLIFDVGSGPAVVVSNSTRTFNDAPDGFDAVPVQNVGSTYMIVSWDLPTDSNGILINFSLYCNGALAGVLPLTVISYNTTGLLPFTLYMYMSSSHAHRHCTPVGMGVISAAASLPRPYGGAYSHSPIPQLEQDVGMGHVFPPPPQTGNPGSITEIECTLLSGSAEQDALTMKESPLKNLIPFFLRPHPSWGWLQND
eukprot:Em0023g669a